MDKKNPKIVVIIPAFNEENAVAKVIADIPKSLVSAIIVANNNSSDNTRRQALTAGATVVDEPTQGYGNACLKGIEFVKEQGLNPDIIVFLDADYSDYPEEISKLIAPILEDEMDMVIGSRALGNRAKRSMQPQQIFGNWLATRLMKLLYNARYSDLGPFRAIRWNALLALDMKDKTYGWTVEMQLKAAKQKMKIAEVPVSYRARIGHSKISGTVKGTVMAGYKIITTIFKYL
ncbi:MAG: glycosyltransferase family 2 protein [Chitinophagaceae bacterium]